jgi:hypothetical protein
MNYDIKEIVQRLNQYPKAETFEDSSEIFNFYEEPFNYYKIGNSNNYLIQGIKGSGKTMFLKVYYKLLLAISLCEMCQSENKATIFPVFISFPSSNSNIDVYSQIIKHLLSEFKNLSIRLTTLLGVDGKTDIKMVVEEEIVKPLDKFCDDERYKDIIARFYTKTSTSNLLDNLIVYDKLTASIKEGRIRNFINRLSSLNQIRETELNYQKLKEECYNRIKTYVDGIIIFIDEIDRYSLKIQRNDEEMNKFKILLEDMIASNYFRVVITTLMQSPIDIIISRIPSFVKQELFFDLKDYSKFLHAREFAKKIIIQYTKIDDLAKIINYDQDSYDDILDKGIDVDYSTLESDALEQLIFSTKGQPRWIFDIVSKILEKKMKKGNINTDGLYEIQKEDLFEEICEEFGNKILSNAIEFEAKSIIDNYVAKCKDNKTFRFLADTYEPKLNMCLYHSLNPPLLERYEYRGGKSIYEFNYAFCILVNLPTHVLKNNINQEDNNRNLLTGMWIETVYDGE